MDHNISYEDYRPNDCYEYYARTVGSFTSFGVSYLSLLCGFGIVGNIAAMVVYLRQALSPPVKWILMTLAAANTVVLISAIQVAVAESQFNIPRKVEEYIKYYYLRGASVVYYMLRVYAAYLVICAIIERCVPLGLEACIIKCFGLRANDEKSFTKRGVVIRVIVLFILVFAFTLFTSSWELNVVTVNSCVSRDSPLKLYKDFIYNKVSLQFVGPFVVVYYPLLIMILFIVAFVALSTAKQRQHTGVSVNYEQLNVEVAVQQVYTRIVLSIVVLYIVCNVVSLVWVIVQHGNLYNEIDYNLLYNTRNFFYVINACSVGLITAVFYKQLGQIKTTANSKQVPGIASISGKFTEITQG